MEISADECLFRERTSRECWAVFTAKTSGNRSKIKKNNERRKKFGHDYNTKQLGEFDQRYSAGTLKK
jgi:hypothetical protein